MCYDFFAIKLTLLQFFVHDPLAFIVFTHLPWGDNPSILNVFTLYAYCSLQNLFAFIQKETFEGLSQEALSFCIQSLKTASALITQRKVMSSPKCDQHQFSPNDLITSSRESLWDLIKWSPKGKMLWSLSKFIHLITSTLKSLAIRAIWLALSSVIYS